MADAQDLKSCDPYRSYRFDPGLRHHLFSGIQGSKPIILIIPKHRGVEQLVARRAHNPKVRGSSPLPATNVWNADVAQSVERILGKDKVTGSIPVISSIYKTAA